jgi:hypothetical protein
MALTGPLRRAADRVHIMSRCYGLSNCPSDVEPIRQVPTVFSC